MQSLGVLKSGLDFIHLKRKGGKKVRKKVRKLHKVVFESIEFCGLLTYFVQFNNIRL